jgi:hypothetical protein
MLNTATPTWQRDFVADRAGPTRELHIWCLRANHNLNVENEASAAIYRAQGGNFGRLMSGLGIILNVVSRIFAVQQMPLLSVRLCRLSASQFKDLTRPR